MKAARVHFVGALFLWGSLTLAGCKESPFSTLAETPRCGGPSAPCHYRCDLPCAAQAVSSAIGCLIPLEGKLASDRRSCSFDDRSEAKFTGALATTQAALDSQDIGFSLIRQGSSCITVRAGRHQPNASDPEVTEVTVGGQRYGQKLWFGAAADGGSAMVTRIEVECQERVHYLGKEPSICAECGSGDGGCAASPPVVRLRVTLGSSLQFLLEGAGRATPLFTCRP